MFNVVYFKDMPVTILKLIFMFDIIHLVQIGKSTHVYDYQVNPIWVVSMDHHMLSNYSQV